MASNDIAAPLTAELGELIAEVLKDELIPFELRRPITFPLSSIVQVDEVVEKAVREAAQLHLNSTLA